MELSLPGVDRILRYLDELLVKDSYEKQSLLQIYKQNTNFLILLITTVLDKVINCYSSVKEMGNISIKVGRNFFKYLREQGSLKQEKVLPMHRAYIEVIKYQKIR